MRLATYVAAILRLRCQRMTALDTLRDIPDEMPGVCQHSQMSRPMVSIAKVGCMRDVLGGQEARDH